MRQIAKYYVLSPKTQPFSPLGLSPALWLDASDTATITASSGSVSQWDDKSGNGRNAVQGSAVLQPSSGSSTINAKNALSFSSDLLRAPSTAFTQAQPITWFAVASTNNTGATGRQLIGNNSTTPTLYQTSSTWHIFAGSVVNSAVSVDTNAHLFTAVYDGASSSLRLDRSQIASGNAGSSGYSNHQILIGTDSTGLASWSGLVAELVAFFGTLSATDRDKMETYLRDKWGTP